jgi:hypothetical protein
VVGVVVEEEEDEVVGVVEVQVGAVALLELEEEVLVDLGMEGLGLDLVDEHQDSYKKNLLM